MKPTKPTSFAAAQGKAPFDWRAFLLRTDLTDENWTGALALAKSWITCSCGNLCSVLPRDLKDPSSGTFGGPLDPILARLGGADKGGFFEALGRRATSEALHILDLIDLRAGWLIAEMRREARTNLKAAQAKVKELEAAS